MTDPELLALAIEMRRAQVKYFNHGRSRDQLLVAKELERKLDAEVRRRDVERAGGGRTDRLF